MLQVLLADPAEEYYGLELSAATQLPSGTLHPILARLESLGWLESHWENADPRAEGRPRRRYYKLSPDGIVQAGAALARARAEAAKLGTLHPGLAGGVR
ncbi:helix-turn-helix transcriptional regulator [Amycolatopsis sp. NPDC004625]|uniref:PadR family transcriptional regulator n=1 Tax=Amycolatopsis sp. NPDC004625 TaxID=3154670 RepID=UPI0033AB4674